MLWPEIIHTLAHDSILKISNKLLVEAFCLHTCIIRFTRRMDRVSTILKCLIRLSLNFIYEKTSFANVSLGVSAYNTIIYSCSVNDTIQKCS